MLIFSHNFMALESKDCWMLAQKVFLTPQASRMNFTCSNSYLYVSASMCINNVYIYIYAHVHVISYIFSYWFCEFCFLFWEASLIPYIIRFGSSSELHKSGLEVPGLVTSSLTQILTCWWCCLFLGKSFGCSPLYHKSYQDMFNLKISDLNQKKNTFKESRQIVKACVLCGVMLIHTIPAKRTSW